jgi:hypothetical protein
MPGDEEGSVATRDTDKERAKAAAAAEQVREDLSLTDGVDPLEAILAIDKNPDEVQDTLPVPIIGGAKIPWTFRALSGEEIDDIDEQCTTWVKRGRGERVKERDTQRFERMIVAKATLTPNLDDDKILKKFGNVPPEKRLVRILLPGTTDGLSAKVLELSGYTDDLIATAGN